MEPYDEWFAPITVTVNGTRYHFTRRSVAYRFILRVLRLK